MRARADRWDKPKRDYLEHVKVKTGIALELEGRSARWATGPKGTIGIMASDAGDGKRWWLGFDEKESTKRHPLGLVLLCRSNDTLLAFGLPWQRVLGFLP
jgi:hypothetical protein